MNRRSLLVRLGASLAALPLASCGAHPGEPPAPPAPPPPPVPPAPVGSATPPAVAPAASPAPPPASSTAEAKAPSPASAFARVVARVGRNHGHVLLVSFADVQAGVDKAYDLSGTAGHPHAITLAAADMKRLAGGEAIRRVSSREGGHAHRVLVRCAPAVDPPELANVCAIEVAGKDDHEFAITAADMAAKAERTYDVQGIAGHTHSVHLGAEGFGKLAAGKDLTLRTSAADDHTHEVFIRYPATGKKAG